MISTRGNRIRSCKCPCSFCLPALKIFGAIASNWPIIKQMTKISCLQLPLSVTSETSDLLFGIFIVLSI